MSFGLSHNHIWLSETFFYLAGGLQMKIGYIRVSTLEQNTVRQEVIMQELEAEEIFIDRLSGKDTKRPELQKMMTFARSGDTVIVESISRFARNTKNLLALIDLLTAKGVDFVSKKENIDTKTPAGRFMLTVFGAVSELEREYILQRQKEGIAIAKEQGKYKGRKRIENTNFDVVYDKWRAKEIAAVEAMKILSMKKSTFYRRVSAKLSQCFEARIKNLCYKNQEGKST
jgi:DNA invertase Pin-like site-specific DNA recombinase